MSFLLLQNGSAKVLLQDGSGGLLLQPTATSPAVVVPDRASLALSTFNPSILATANQVCTPSPTTLTFLFLAPSVLVSDNITCQPGTLMMAIVSQSPTVTTGGNLVCIPHTSALTIASYAPTVLGPAATTGGLSSFRIRAANARPLFNANLRINSPSKGYKLKFHMKSTVEETALAHAVLLATRIKGLLPGDCEIFYATLTKDDSPKDSRFLRSACGRGLYATTGIPVGTTVCNRGEDHVSIRCEHEGGAHLVRKIGPVPDNVIESELIIETVDDVLGVPATLPVAWATLDSYGKTLNLFMQEIVLYCDHVEGRNAPGPNLSRIHYVNAFFVGVSGKKGGRNFR